MKAIYSCDNSKLITGIESIDFFHKKFIGLMNSLIETIESNQCIQNQIDILQNISYYTEIYFIEEELNLQYYSYPKFANHKESHREFTAKIIEFTSRYMQEKKPICEELLAFMEDWYQTHIVSQDNDEILFLKEKGVK